jgi:hypothetical protein
MAEINELHVSRSTCGALSLRVFVAATKQEFSLLVTACKQLHVRRFIYSRAIKHGFSLLVSFLDLRKASSAKLYIQTRP